MRLPAALVLVVLLAASGRAARPASVPHAQVAGSGSCLPTAACCDADYWIISSHRCPDDPGGCPACRFEVFRISGGVCRRQAGEADLVAALQPGVAVCIVIHGSYTSFSTLVRESHRVYHWLKRPRPGRPLHLVFYTWPATPPTWVLPALDVGVLGRRSAQHGYYLAQLIQRLPPRNPVCLLGHSHGARTAAATLHLLAGGAVQGHRLPAANYGWPGLDGHRPTTLRAVPGGREAPARRNHRVENPRRDASGFRFAPTPATRLRAVLLAAAVDRNWLNPGQRYGRSLCLAESVLNLRNRRDPALALYPLRRLGSRRALGQTGFTRSDRRRLGGWSAKAVDLDVTRAVGCHHYWTWYCRREIAAAIAPWVYVEDGAAASPR